MTIWMLNHYAGSPSGTPATRTFDLSKELVRLGHQVTIFACSFNHYSFAEEQLRPYQLFRFAHLDGVRFVWIRSVAYRRNDYLRFLNMLTFALLAFAIGLWLRPRPHIVIGTTVHPFTPVSAYFVSRLRRCRFWLDITDIWPQSLIELGHLKAKSLPARVIARLEEFSLAKADLVMSVIPNIADYVREKGLMGKRTAWIPNGIDSARASLINATDVPENSLFTVAYAGGFAAAHALGVVLDAAAIVQSAGEMPIRFVLIGNGPEMDTVRAGVERLGLKNVSLPGFIRKQDLYSRLAQADAFLCTGRSLPVYRYGISFNKIFDYLLVGRPVIFALHSSNDPIAEAGAGLSVPAEDPKALADAIVRLSKMPIQARREMGKRGREYVLKEFDYRTICERLVSVL